MTETCELCNKCEADDAVIMSRDDVVLVCWRCCNGIPAELLSDFVKSVRSGVSPKLAAMFVTQQTPTIHTNDTFGAGWKLDGGQFADMPEPLRKAYLQEAKDAGVSITGKKYMHGLADYPGDPTAWVSTKDDIKRVLREKGYGCERLGIQAKPKEGEAKATPLGEDIIARHMNNYLAGVPKKARTKKMVEETRAAIIEKHGPRKPAAGLDSLPVRRSGRGRATRKVKAG